MIKRFTRFMQNINGIQLSAIGTGARGGILLDLELVWTPFTFQAAPDNDVPRGGDIWVLIGDTTGSRPIIGQTTSTADSSIVVPQGGFFEWSHPLKSELINADSMISKLAISGGREPLGAFAGFVQIAALPQIPAFAHSMVIHATLLEFD
jgi:hypothetical protein